MFNDSFTHFEKVVHMANDLNKNNNVGLVVGATAPMELRMIRDISQGMPFLIPGVGAQGGELSSSLSIVSKQITANLSAIHIITLV